jgi:hypothetical protein
MRSILRTLTIAITCTVLIAGAVLADDDATAPPDTDGDPTEPFGGTISALGEAVLSDWGRIVIPLTWLVPWVLR